MEASLQPGRHIGWKEGYAFASGLRQAEGEISELLASDPARAAMLYETFVAACNQKADEVDDSDGEFGTFAGSLFSGWIKARQAAGADADETAGLLFDWMDDDPYGFCNDLELETAKVLDRAGLTAFELQVLTRFDQAFAAPGPKEDRVRNYECQRWSRVLRSIYSQQRNVPNYLDLTARTELTQADCQAIAAMLQAKRKPDEALAWIERGIEMVKPGEFQSDVGGNLTGMRRALLTKLGRGGEPLDSAWTEFQAHPGRFTYEELIRYVPKPVVARRKRDGAAGRNARSSRQDVSRGRGESLPRFVHAYYRCGQEQSLSCCLVEP